MSLGIVVLGHGSSAAVGEANHVVFQVAEMIKEKMKECLIETAIMNRESNLPGIVDAVDRLVKEGAEKVMIVPMFLFNGLHIRKNIPEEIELLRQKYPDVPLTLTGHIGADARIADILIERIHEAQHAVYH